MQHTMVAAMCIVVRTHKPVVVGMCMAWGCYVHVPVVVMCLWLRLAHTSSKFLSRCSTHCPWFFTGRMKLTLVQRRHCEEGGRLHSLKLFSSTGRNMYSEIYIGCSVLLDRNSFRNKNYKRRFRQSHLTIYEDILLHMYVTVILSFKYDCLLTECRKFAYTRFSIPYGRKHWGGITFGELQPSIGSPNIFSPNSLHDANCTVEHL